jgi:hypothetical protein
MFKNTIIVLIYHRHTLLKLRYVIPEQHLFPADYTALYLRIFSSSETFNLKSLHLFYAGNLNRLHE